MGKSQSVGKGHTKWLGGLPVAHPWFKVATKSSVKNIPNQKLIYQAL